MKSEKETNYRIIQRLNDQITTLTSEVQSNKGTGKITVYQTAFCL